MSKLDGFSPEDQVTVRQCMPLLIEAQVALGLVAENEAAIKAAMPAVFEMAVAVVEHISSEFASMTGYDAAAKKRIRALGIRFMFFQLENAKTAFDTKDLLQWLSDGIKDAKEVSNAVDEYLCG